ncbi:hypothetical protein T07_9294 [Trichinella nelsoni]|uniref:Uncharacterized protein n=1 Tax=Trichinella nelsoni TaxID=6336 RepID=A0A0V0RCV2_9BILA|nr:hypothetical protein T07_9294 [Trichinella nelsoni]
MNLHVLVAFCLCQALNKLYDYSTNLSDLDGLHHDGSRKGDKTALAEAR